MSYRHVKFPESGQKITVSDNRLVVSDNPILGFVEGDGIGVDIWAATQTVLDAAVAKAYEGKKKIAWYEIFAGEKANDAFGEWLPEATVDAVREHKVAIKGP